MKTKRIIQKGNIVSVNYDIRITEPDGKVYYYHIFRLEDKESIIYSKNSFNMKNVIEISWDDLSIELKMVHYNNIYPEDELDGYEKNCFIYGKENAEEMKRIAEEIQKEEEERQLKKEEFLSKNRDISDVSYYIIEAIYDEIGPWDTIKVVYNEWQKNYRGKFLIDDRIYVIFNSLNDIYVEEKNQHDIQRKDWGTRVKEISKKAGTSFEMATIVGNIQDSTKAIEVLCKIKQLLYNDKEIKNDYRYLGNYCLKRIFSKYLPQEYIEQLNWNKKFYNSVETIMKNKK